MSRVLSDSSLFYRCQVIALSNSCQNKFGLLPGEKKVWAMHRAKKSTLEQFPLTVGQNNFGNKIPFKHRE